MGATATVENPTEEDTITDGTAYMGTDTVYARDEDNGKATTTTTSGGEVAELMRAQDPYSMSMESNISGPMAPMCIGVQNFSYK